ncbi:hypothetical protein [Chryseobacterium sp. JUb7]|uniref:hypothetical protein n=1 Tax=Chryseobacterium sp. JUb7 TaxID=2940599 RepID=UPI00216A18E6|nr:hypothetical protein [Chryseobacterium sp. JUb7]MCS3529289.1 hypothetical protein [Chryseobacterium sp. JUb7]
MKKTVLSLVLAVSAITFKMSAQIGINTANPIGAFTVDGAKDDPVTGTPTTAQQANDFSVAATGSVGIGTIAPAAKLDIVGDTFGIKRSPGSGSWDNLWIDLSNTSAPTINASGAETGLQFNVGSNTAGTYGDGQTLVTVATMRPNGNMGVGTAAPATKFHVEGAEVRLSNTTSTWGLASETTSPTHQFSIIDRTNNVRRIILQENGNTFMGGTLGTAGANAAISTVGTSVGIGNNAAPTNTLDINGTTRVRTMSSVAGSTVVTPVYADATGVLVKPASATLGGVTSATSASVASGGTGTLITGMVDGALYRATVLLGNACGAVAMTDFMIQNSSSNGYFAINGQNGLLVIASPSNNHPAFAQSVKSTVGVSWAGVTGCADGGNSTAFDYTLTMPSAGTINVTNNGNIARAYSITLTRIN